MQRIKHCDFVLIDQEIERTLRNFRKLQAKKVRMEEICNDGNSD